MVIETNNSEINYPSRCHNNGDDVVFVVRLGLGLGRELVRVKGGQKSSSLHPQTLEREVTLIKSML
jgi:hypothetical protein